MDDKILCTCRKITYRQIVKAINEKGCKTFEDIQRETEAGTVCGCCEDDINDIIKKHTK